MTPFQIFYMWLSLAVFALAWLRGGHTERAGVTLTVSCYLLSYFVQGMTIDGFKAGEFIVDLAYLGGLAWLALRRDRWWPLAACAFALLSVVAHSVMLMVPGLDTRADVAARWGLGALTVLCLGAGVVERWLAGERPVSTTATWPPRRRVLNI